MASMQYAIDHGADMVEFDVQVIFGNSHVWTRMLFRMMNKRVEIERMNQLKKIQVFMMLSTQLKKKIWKI